MLHSQGTLYVTDGNRYMYCRCFKYKHQFFKVLEYLDGSVSS